MKKELPDDQRCTAILRDGKRCPARRKSDLATCFSHDPKTLDDLQRRRIESMNEYQISVEKRKEDLRNGIADLESKLSRIRMQNACLEIQIDKEKAVLEALIAASDEAGDIERLLSTFKVAEKNGDAKTMHEVQKSLYYARRNAKRALPKEEEFDA